MFYLSALKQGTLKKYCITDTEDGVTEALSEREVIQILDAIGRNGVRGILYNGKTISGRPTSPALEYLVKIPVGMKIQISNIGINKESITGVLASNPLGDKILIRRGLMDKIVRRTDLLSPDVLVVAQIGEC